MTTAEGIIVPDSIVERIKKLSAHADSAAKIGSQAEAEAFAAKVSSLLLEYNLSLSDIPVDERPDDRIDRTHFDPLAYGLKAKKSRVLWQEQLAVIIAEANFCRVFVSVGRNSVSFIGKAHNRDVVVWLYSQLVAGIEATADKEYVRFFYKCRDEGDVTKARGYRGSFLLGCVTAIASRLKKDRLALLDINPSAQALVLASDHELEAYAESNSAGKASTLNGPSDHNTAGLQEGFKYGHSIDIDDTLRKKDRAKQAALPAPTPQVAEDIDARLEAIYTRTLEAAGIAHSTNRQGVAFNIRTKKFSIVAAIDAAARRLGASPTHFAIFSGTLYLSCSTLPLNPWTRISTTESSELLDSPD